MKAETHLDGGCRLSTTAWRNAAAIIEAMGLRELLRASREETMPIDRWGFAPVVGKGLCNAVAFISRRPHPDRTPKLKTNWQPLFRSTVKVTKASRSEFAFGPVPPATFVARLAVGAAVERLLWLLTGFERR